MHTCIVECDQINLLLIKYNSVFVCELKKFWVDLIGIFRNQQRRSEFHRVFGLPKIKARIIYLTYMTCIDPKGSDQIKRFCWFEVRRFSSPLKAQRGARSLAERSSATCPTDQLERSTKNCNAHRVCDRLDFQNSRVEVNSCEF